jgi:hypothetical protein
MDQVKNSESLDVRAQLQQAATLFNEPIFITLRDKKIKIRPLTKGCQWLVSKYLCQQQELSENPNLAEIMVKMAPNGKLQAKAVSAVILNDTRWVFGLAKIKLFHWIHWRYINWAYNNADITTALVAMTEKIGSDFFLTIMNLTKGMNAMKKKDLGSSPAKQK